MFHVQLEDNPEARNQEYETVGEYSSISEAKLTQLIQNHLRIKTTTHNKG